MPTLHMEVETCRTAQQSIQQAAEQLEALITNVNNTLQGLHSGAWVGNSADQFFSESDPWCSSVKGKSEELTNLAMRLSSEITEWENMAAKLG